MAACVHNCENPFGLEPDQCQIMSNSFFRFVKLCAPTLAKPALNCVDEQISNTCEDHDDMWLNIRSEAESDLQQEPLLRDHYFSSILSHNSLESALANLLAMKLCNSSLSKSTLFQIFFSVFAEDHQIGRAVRNDLKAVRERDPACTSHVHCFLYFKGFQACQAHRVAHKLWSQKRTALAVLIQSRVSEVFGVDIHPAAKIGGGLVIDHATGVVIGETAVVGDNVTILHDVTLGGTGKVSGDRHPKIGDGVFIGAGSKVLGSIRIGEGARIGAGSVVLKEVPPSTTAVGNPARIIGGEIEGLVLKAKGRNQGIEECSTFSGCYEFGASRHLGETGLRAEASETVNPYTSKTGDFSHRPAPMPSRGSCRGEGR